MNNFKDKLKFFIQLVRLEYCFFASFGVIVSGVISRDLQGLQIEYLYGFFISLFLAMATFSINDFFDYTADKKNKRTDRPLLTGKFQKKLALYLGIILFFLTGLISTFINYQAMIFTWFNLMIFSLYSPVFKKIPYLKNFIVAYGFLAGIIFGTILSDQVAEPIILFFGFMAFIVAIGFENMIDIPDSIGDLQDGVKTFANKFSKKTAAKITIFFYFIIVFLDPLPFFISIDPGLYRDYVFLFLISIPILGYITVSLSLIVDQSNDNIFRLKDKTTKIMQFGTLAYLIGILL